jgi:hypothetical protein
MVSRKSPAWFAGAAAVSASERRLMRAIVVFIKGSGIRIG